MSSNHPTEDLAPQIATKVLKKNALAKKTEQRRLRITLPPEGFIADERESQIKVPREAFRINSHQKKSCMHFTIHFSIASGCITDAAYSIFYEGQGMQDQKSKTTNHLE